MSRIPRVTQQIFASTANAGDIEQFGSFANGGANYSGDIAVIQALSAWLSGWASAIEGVNSPCLEDFNGAFKVFTQQIANILQDGVPLWDAGTTYYAGSVVQSAGVAYVSLIDANLNNAVTVQSDWRLLSRLITNTHAIPASVGGATAIVPVSAGDEDIYVKGSSTWTAQNASEANSWGNLCYSPALNLYVAVAQNGTHRVMTSPDGVVWTNRVASSAVVWRSVCWSPDLGLFVAVAAEVATTNSVMTSPNGITWTTRIGIQDAWLSVIWSHRLQLFIAAGQAGSSGKYVMTSPDGITWTGQTAAAGVYTGIVDSPELGLLVAVGAGGNFISTSINGTTWKTSTTTNATGFTTVAWSSYLSLFVAVSTDGTNQIATSSDGINWADSAAIPSAWQTIIWSAELGLFMAVAFSGAIRTMVSSDGINWNGLAAATANQWEGLVWSPNQHSFVATAISGASRVQVFTIATISAPLQIASGIAQSKRLSVIGADNTAPLLLTNGNGIFCKRPIYIKNNTVSNFLWDSVQSLYVEAIK